MNKAVIGLSIALGLALIVIAFLLGQRSVQTAPAQAPGVVKGEDESGPIALAHRRARDGSAAEAMPDLSDGASPRESEHGAYARAGRRLPPVPMPQEEPLDAGHSDRTGDVVVKRSGDTLTIVSQGESGAAVSDYLDRVHAVQVGPMGVDQNAFAQQLLGEGMKGDASSMDELLRQAKSAERDAKAIRPPPGAEAHHAQLLDLLAESSKLLAAERDAIVNKNSEGVETLLSTARALQQKAQALEAAEAKLKAR